MTNRASDRAGIKPATYLKAMGAIVAMLDVTANAAKLIGKDGASATLPASIANTTAIARDMIEEMRCQIAEPMRDADAIARAAADAEAALEALS